MSRGTEFRLTAEDEERVRSRQAEAVETWRREGPSWTPGSVDLEALYRLGCHSIGCSDADLREVERDWIRARAREAAGLEASGLTPEEIEANRKSWASMSDKELGDAAVEMTNKIAAGILENDSDSWRFLDGVRVEIARRWKERAG